jgi:hypothetical protein
MGGERAVVEDRGVAWSAGGRRAAVVLEGAVVAFARGKAAEIRETAPAGWTRHDIKLAERFGASVVVSVYREAGGGAVDTILNTDVVGVRFGGNVVVFPRDGEHPRAVSFEARGGGAALRMVLTGLEGGAWEIWWDGALVEMGLAAGPGGTLRFEGAPGGYFLRRR